MIGNNADSHQPGEWPDSLALALDRKRGLSSIMPLTVIVEEIAEWVELASGAEAWKKRANRDSLQADLDESAEMQPA